VTRAALEARLAAADPARRAPVDEAARERLWALLLAQPAPAATRLAARARARLRRRMLVLLPSLAVLGGVGLSAETAWCAPCRHHSISTSARPVRAAPAAPATVLPVRVEPAREPARGR
jgi:hypothetical protein